MSIVSPDCAIAIAIVSPDCDCDWETEARGEMSIVSPDCCVPRLDCEIELKGKWL